MESEKRVRVLHVAQPVDGGVGRVVADLIEDQVARGWTPEVACPPAGELPQAARARGARVHPWAAVRSPGPSTLGETAGLADIVERVRPDVVHLHGSKAGLCGRLAVRGRIPTLFQPHLWSFDSDRSALARPALTWERFAARWTDAIVCVSDDERNRGRAAGITGRLVVVCNGVDTDRLRPTAPAPVRARLGFECGPLAVCVARLAPLKGQDMLLSAWPAVLAQVPDAQLVFVGDGPQRRDLLTAHPIATDRSVHWIGHRDDPADYMLAADVVVVPSRAEGMALVPIEAMALGRSVVAFDAGGIRQSVGDAGAVLPIGDIPALTREIVARLHDPGLCELEGKRGRVRAESYFAKHRAADEVAATTAGIAGMQYV